MPEDQVGRALDDWAGSAITGLPSVQFIKARGTGRIRRKRAATVVTAVAAVAALTVGLIQGGTPRAPSNRTRAAAGTRGLVHLVAHVRRVEVVKASAEASAARADSALLVNATRALATSPSMGNILLSPSSLTGVLTQVELGARGATATEIAGALGQSGVSAMEQARNWNALSSAVALDASRSGVVLHQQSGLFLERTLPVRNAYLDALAAQFGDGIWRADFRHHPAAASRAISAWAAGITHFRVPALLSGGSISDRTALVVANAFRFEAKWASSAAFDSRRTRTASFHLAAGKTVPVPMMHLQANLEASSASGVIAVKLPYAGRAFSAVAIEPSHGTLQSMLSTWTPSRLAAVVGGLHQMTVTLGLPRFSIASSTSCDNALRSMGIRQAYSSQADFSGISSTPLQLSRVSQSESISVNEHGTDAAGATAAALQIQSGNAQLLTATFDHPFLFLVRDNSTGAVLFEAVVADPSAAA